MKIKNNNKLPNISRQKTGERVSVRKRENTEWSGANEYNSNSVAENGCKFATGYCIWAKYSGKGNEVKEKLFFTIRSYFPTVFISLHSFTA